jgi:2-polyprenyl-3-methyl-5-hydroxy-6-metoxy-1,4-benzoquinol methylase
VRTIHKLLAHPLTKKLELDDPLTTYRRKQIIQEKEFLHRIYEEWYSYLSSPFHNPEKPILEIGSGAGFLSDYINNLISSDIRS